MRKIGYLYGDFDLKSPIVLSLNGNLNLGITGIYNSEKKNQLS